MRGFIWCELGPRSVKGAVRGPGKRGSNQHILYGILNGQRDPHFYAGMDRNDQLLLTQVLPLCYEVPKVAEKVTPASHVASNLKDARTGVATRLNRNSPGRRTTPRDASTDTVSRGNSVHGTWSD